MLFRSGAAVGSYDLVASEAGGGTFLPANYEIAYLSGILTVTRSSVSGSIVASSKVYDGNDIASVQTSLSGVRPGDSITLAGGTARFDSAAAGAGKVVTLADATLSGAQAANYTLTGVSTTTASITPKLLSVSGLAASPKTYDGTTAATLTGTPLLEGKVAGDDVTLSGAATATFASAGAGSNKPVNVTGLSLAGTAKANYTLSPLTLSADLSKEIGRAHV